LARAGRLDEGIVELRKVVEQDPNGARARLNLGVALAEAGDLEGAIAQHLAILYLNPDTNRLALTHFNLGTFYRRTGQVARAVEHHRKALELDPLNADAHFDLGELLSANGQLVEALPHYARAGELRPRHGMARLRQATVLMRLDRFPEAGIVLDEGLMELPTDHRLRDALARLLAASPDRSLRDGQRSLSLATQALDSVRVPPYAETLAMALAEVGRFGEADQLQRRVLAEARKSGQDAHSKRLARNLALYENGQACCASSADVLPPQ
jgi:tetratricopeptide (TPR) repeat protein